MCERALYLLEFQTEEEQFFQREKNWQQIFRYSKPILFQPSEWREEPINYIYFYTANTILKKPYAFSEEKHS